MGDDTGFADFIRSRPCCACGKIGQTVVAHIRSRGAGHGVLDRDGLPNVIPLCVRCHTEQHAMGWSDFRTEAPTAWFDERVAAVEVRRLFFGDAS